jgi:glycogen debranching enzyme
MDKESVKKRLKEDIQTLMDYRGFVRAGHPRFNVLFGRDSLFVSWQLLDYDPEIAAITLKTLAKLQASEIDPERDAEPGKILHEMWEGDRREIDKLHLDSVPFPYYGSVDATPLFIVVAHKYFEKTKDKELIAALWPNICAAKNWMMQYGDENRDGFLDFRRKNPNGPLNQCWKDGKESPQFGERPIAPVEVQGYAYEALKGFNILAEAINAPERVAKEHLQNLKINFDNKFFWKEGGFYYLAIDGTGNGYKSIASNPGHLLFTNLIDDSHKNQIISRLFQPDMWTSYGIRTHSEKNKDFDAFSYQLGSVWPFDNWMIAEGLRVSGFNDEYMLIKEALLRAFREFGKIPELYAVDTGGKIQIIPQANSLQAWSSAGLLDLLSRE